MKRLFLPFFSLLAWAGCSGDQPGPNVEDDGIKTESLFCAEWAKAACNEEVIAACNGDRSGCLTTQKFACQVLVPVGYESDNAEDCLDAVADAYEDAELTAEELDVVLNLGGACAGLIDGGLDQGESCASSFECNGLDGFECVIKPGQAEGTCQVPTFAGAADSCAEPDVVCDSAYYCVDSADGPVCLNRRASGSCTSDAACQAQLRCDIPADAASGTCGARTTNGNPCQADRDCVSGVCIGSTEIDKICVERIILTVRDPLCSELR